VRRSGGRHRCGLQGGHQDSAGDPGAASQEVIEANSVAGPYCEMYIPTVESREPDGQSGRFDIATLAASRGLATGMRRAGLGLSECDIANSDAAWA
jgi:hypothetical protein